MYNLNPGSKEAKQKGCICPVLDNSHGAGYLGDGEKYGWFVTEGCPIHPMPERVKNTLDN